MFRGPFLKPGPTQCFGHSQHSRGEGDAIGFFKKIVDLAQVVLPAAEEFSNAFKQKKHRRTDQEFCSDPSDLEKSACDFQHKTGVPLSFARGIAKRSPGVYVLYLDGVPMKCGRAAFEAGVSGRLNQYYNLNYDNKSREGNTWSVSAENRDSVVVSWQCCPKSKCVELEYKLFKKYGKGLWAKRMPEDPGTDSWDLLI